MRNATGWAAAALIAVAGCGGGDGIARDQSAGDRGGTDLGERAPADAICGACAFEGSGPIAVGATSVTASISAAPVDGAPPPSEGGTAASGTIAFALHDGAGGDVCDGTIDTIWSCEIENGVAKVTFSGTYHDGQRFTLELAGGDFRVHDFDLCEPMCPEGQCLCGETQQCEPCDAHDPELPPPPDGAASPPPDGTSSPSDDSTPPSDDTTDPPYIPL